jgi:hypothetical protein
MELVDGCGCTTIRSLLLNDRVKSSSSETCFHAEPSDDTGTPARCMPCPSSQIHPKPKPNKASIPIDLFIYHLRSFGEKMNILIIMENTFII